MIEMIYKGKGFIGYDPSDKRMVLINRECGQFDLWVEYKGQEMLVRKHEVVPKGK